VSVEAFEDNLIEWIQQVMEGQNSFAQVPETKIQEIYALAYLLYQNQQYLEASHFFRLLVVARPAEVKFWKGLGACLQMQKDYEGALNCYMCCTQLIPQDQSDPYVYVQAADCYFALKQKKAALRALEEARLRGEKKKDQAILQHVAFMHQMWSSKS
jgi:secretion system chaperone SscA